MVGLHLRFVTERNFQFQLNQALFKQDGEDCTCRVLFSFSAKENLIVFGQASLYNMNVTVDFDNGLIGFSNGVNLTPTPINYQARVIMMAVVFGIIALISMALSFTIDRAQKAATTKQTQSE